MMRSTSLRSLSRATNSSHSSFNSCDASSCWRYSFPVIAIYLKPLNKSPVALVVVVDQQRRMSFWQQVEAANDGHRRGDRREDVQDLRVRVVPLYLCEESPVNRPKGLQGVALS